MCLRGVGKMMYMITLNSKMAECIKSINHRDFSLAVLLFRHCDTWISIYNIYVIDFYIFRNNSLINHSILKQSWKIDDNFCARNFTRLELKMFGLGELPKGYNPKVHGPYDPAIYYGPREYWVNTFIGELDCIMDIHKLQLNIWMFEY